MSFNAAGGSRLGRPSAAYCQNVAFADNTFQPAAAVSCYVPRGGVSWVMLNIQPNFWSLNAPNQDDAAVFEWQATSGYQIIVTYVFMSKLVPENLTGIPTLSLPCAITGPDIEISLSVRLRSGDLNDWELTGAGSTHVDQPYWSWLFVEDLGPAASGELITVPAVP